MSPADQARLAHTVRACAVIIREAKVEDREDIDSRDERIDGLIHQLLKIGEAAKHLAPETRDSLPSIPWRKYMRTRDILVHRYYEVDNDIVWGIMIDEVPKLRDVIVEVYPNLPAE